MKRILVLLAFTLSFTQLNCGPQSSALSTDDPANDRRASVATKIVKEITEKTDLGKVYSALLKNITSDDVDTYRSALVLKDAKTQGEVLNKIISLSQCEAHANDADCVSDLMSEENQSAILLLTHDLLTNHVAIKSKLILSSSHSTLKLDELIKDLKNKSHTLKK